MVPVCVLRGAEVTLLKVQWHETSCVGGDIIGGRKFLKRFCPSPWKPKDKPPWLMVVENWFTNTSTTTTRLVCNVFYNEQLLLITVSELSTLTSVSPGSADRSHVSSILNIDIYSISHLGIVKQLLLIMCHYTLSAAHYYKLWSTTTWKPKNLQWGSKEVRTKHSINFLINLSTMVGVNFIHGYLRYRFFN